MSRLTEFVRRLLGSNAKNDVHDREKSSVVEWLEKMNEPFFQSRGDAESYINREIALTLPEGWAVHQYSHEDHQSAWTIVPDNTYPETSTDYGYIVRVPESLECVILTHGNKDAGTFGLHHALQSALVIALV